MKNDIELYAVWVLEEQNEPSYIVVIPTEINLNSETNTMTFDIEATLNFFPRTKLLNINIAKEYALKYIIDGQVKDSIKYEITKNNEKIKVGEKVASFNSDSALQSYIGKEKLELTVIEKPKYFGSYKGLITFFVTIEENI